MSLLKRAPTPAPRETVISFLNRLAAMKGIPTQQLAHDMGSEFRRMLRHEDESLSALAKWGHISQEQLEEMRSWSVEHVSDVKSKLRGEVLSSRALRNPIIRGCPECLRDDLNAGHDDPADVLVMRGEWQLQDTCVCVLHQKPLVSLWSAQCPRERFDFQSRLKEILPDLLRGKFDRRHQEMTGFDLWLNDRLNFSSDKTWLANHSLHAALAFCRLLGTELAKQGNETHFRQKGFEIAQQGEDAILDALQRLVDLRIKRSGESRKAFGMIYDYLAHYQSDDPELAPLRDLLRDCILGNWALAPGTNVLGEVLSARRLHSVASAVEETGVDPKALTRVLSNLGALPENDRRPDGRKLFDAQTHAALLRELPHLVMFGGLRDTINSTTRELKNLVKDGLLSPRYPDTVLKACWHPADGEALLEELHQLSRPIFPEAVGWESLQRAHSRKLVPLGEIIRAVQRGDLKLGEVSGKTEFSRFCVEVDEVNAWVAEKNFIGRGLIGRLSAAEFAAEIGVHEGGVFTDFVKAGHTPATLSPHPIRKTQLRMTDEDIKRFHAKYTTTAILVARTGLHRNTIRSRLKKADVHPYEDMVSVYPGIYVLDQLNDLFPELVGARSEAMV